MDAIHYSVRQDNAIIKKAVYIAIGIKLDGKKEVIGMWIGGNESARYWLGVLTEIKNRGVQDILIVSVDGLTGFSDAIHAVFPQTEIQRCILHPIRYSTRFVNHKDIKPYMADLKQVYQAPTEKMALQTLDRQLRKVTKSKSIFPTDDALFKSLYLAMSDISAKWIGRPRDWSRILEQLLIHFEGRFSLSDID